MMTFIGFTNVVFQDAPNSNIQNAHSQTQHKHTL